MFTHTHTHTHTHTQDKRVLRALGEYGDFDKKSGKLKSFKVLDTDTSLQKIVKEAKLRRVEVVVIVLYTGPMFVLYNGILRDFGTCGAVPADVEFGSAEFWELLKKVDVSDRMTKAGHKFPTTLHVLASAIKKLQVRSPVSVPLCV